MTAVASPGGDEDAVLKNLVDAAFAGELSSEGKAYLISEHPDLAAVIPDHIEFEAASAVPTNVVPLPAATTAATKCTRYSGYNTLKSLLGFTIYRFTHSASVCSNGSKVTSHSRPTYTISMADPTVEKWTTVDSRVTGVNTYTSKSRIQVKVTQCLVKVGCYSNHYPTGTITARGNNTADIRTTER